MAESAAAILRRAAEKMREDPGRKHAWELATADTWDEIANVSAFEERMAGIYSPSAIEARAVAAARAFLGEA